LISVAKYFFEQVASYGSCTPFGSRLAYARYDLKRSCEAPRLRFSPSDKTPEQNAQYKPNTLMSKNV
jgi:hypothetical protein